MSQKKESSYGKLGEGLVSFALDLEGVCDMLFDSLSELEISPRVVEPARVAAQDYSMGTTLNNPRYSNTPDDGHTRDYTQ